MTQPIQPQNAGSPYPAPGAPAGYGPPPVATRTVMYNQRTSGPNILVRAVWYIFVGWWLTGITMGVAYVAMITVIGIPIALWLINRIPTVLTLRPRRDLWQTSVDQYGNVTHSKVRTDQNGLLVRFAWLVLVGWWLTLIAMAVAYVLMLTIIGIPFGLMLVNRLPRVLTLHRGYA